MSTAVIVGIVIVLLILVGVGLYFFVFKNKEKEEEEEEEEEYVPPMNYQQVKPSSPPPLSSPPSSPPPLSSPPSSPPPLSSPPLSSSTTKTPQQILQEKHAAASVGGKLTLKSAIAASRTNEGLNKSIKVVSDGTFSECRLACDGLNCKSFSFLSWYPVGGDPVTATNRNDTRCDMYLDTINNLGGLKTTDDFERSSVVWERL